jgi:hypothetical protein
MFNDTTGTLIKDSGLTLSGANTGDETTATIKSKLGITTLSGSNTGDQTTITGNAGTATKLLTARTINGVSFDGSANITVADSTKVPTTTTVNGHALSSNVTVTADDVLPTQTGNSGKFLTTNGTTSSWGTAGSGSGDVVGPASATDTAIALYNGTTGKLLKNSGATIDGSGNLTAYTLITTGGDVTTSAGNISIHGNSPTAANSNGSDTYVTGGTATGTGTNGNVYLGLIGHVAVKNASSFSGTLSMDSLTANRTFTYPDTTGTVALTTSNITGSAATITTARTVQTNLASTAAASFNGSANITPGVTGILPVANGGTGSTTQNFVDLTTAQTVAGVKTFSSAPASTVATGTAPLTITSTTKVTNLNADTVDGIHASATPTANQLLALDSNALIPTAALGGVWATWTPTWTNITVGNGTVTARYTQIGKSVFFFLELVFGSTTAITAGYPSVSIPISPKISDSNAGGITTARYLQTGTAWFHGIPALSGSGAATISLGCMDVTGSFVTETGISATAPFTWATGHKLFVQGFYEAA